MTTLTRKETMTPKTKPVPLGFHAITPMLTVREVDKAIDFYKRALGAHERLRFLGPEGKSIMHAEIKIGDSIIMLGEEQPAHGCRGPQSLGGTTVSLYFYIEDVDRAFNQAIAAGATMLMPVADVFWGDRCGQFVDPFGHKRSLATHKEEFSQQEIHKRGGGFFVQMASP